MLCNSKMLYQLIKKIYQELIIKHSLSIKVF